MDVLSIIRSRRSIRKYQRKAVAWDDMAKILEAGRWAPSSGNLQTWKFIVVDDDEAVQTIANEIAGQPWIAMAPACIVACAEPEKAELYYGERGRRLYSIQNLAMAIQNMLLEAHALGLGACCVGAFDSAKLRKLLSIPDNVEPQAIIPIGYPAEKPEEPSRLPLESLAYFNVWRNRIKDVPAFLGYQSVKIQKGLKKGKELLKKAAKKLAEKIRKK